MIKHIIFSGKHYSKFKKNVISSIRRKINQKCNYLHNERKDSNLKDDIVITKLQKIGEIGERTKFNLHFKCDTPNIQCIIYYI